MCKKTGRCNIMQGERDQQTRNRSKDDKEVRFSGPKNSKQLLNIEKLFGKVNTVSHYMGTTINK